MYRVKENTESRGINGINTFFFKGSIMHVFGDHLFLRTEKFFQFWIVLRGKTSLQDNAKEQNETLLILSPRQCSNRGQEKDKAKVAKQI